MSIPDTIAIDFISLKDPVNVYRVAQINRLLRQIVYSGEPADIKEFGEEARHYVWELVGNPVVMRGTACSPASPYARSALRHPGLELPPAPKPAIAELEMRRQRYERSLRRIYGILQEPDRKVTINPDGSVSVEQEPPDAA